MDPMENLEDKICPQHGKPLELFCRTDREYLCVMCTATEHHLHTLVSLRGELKRRRTSMEQKSQENIIEQRQLKIQEIQRLLKISQGKPGQSLKQAQNLIQELEQEMSGTEKNNSEMRSEKLYLTVLQKSPTFTN